MGEVLKHIFFHNPRIAKMLAVERDVKPRNVNFAKVEGGGVIGREHLYLFRVKVKVRV